MTDTDFRIVKQCGKGRDADQILSPITGFWAGCPIPRVDPENSCYEIFDDFTSFDVGDTTSKWTLDATNGTAALVSAEAATGLGGVLALTSTATAHDWASIKVTSTDTGAPFMVVEDNGKELWYAARIYVSSVSVKTMYYLGLFAYNDSEVGTDTSGAMAGNDGIYFRTLPATPTEIDIATALSTTETEIKGAAGTLAASTWTTLGIHFDGAATVSFWQDGALIGSVDTGVTNMPDDIGLTPLFFTKNVDTGHVMNIDWIRCVQKR